ncbi:aspartate-semialdehyde dehydrogenase [Tsuneonella amylolytica]|uniref:aspartate-semialdehyde dehydrogenase n=1 Tax=Tsuneonella amylolytica TaxID=2338327 RepID=UPI000EAABA8C|nr:aspartate-semialdehyde dehydrogenase [Tsuneonella amylolytica]
MRKFAALAALALAACQQPAAERDAPARAATSTAAPSQTPATSAPPRAASTVAPSQVRHAIVDARGLAIGRNPGTATYFAFGTPRAAVEKAGDAWLGKGERSANGECGAGPMEFTRYGELTLNYLDKRLTGWFLKAEPQAVTSDGIRPGARLRDLRITRSVSIEEGSTLDGEFEYLAADGHPIRGFLKGEGRDRTVESLYAGTNCFFR